MEIGRYYKWKNRIAGRPEYSYGKVVGIKEYNGAFECFEILEITGQITLAKFKGDYEEYIEIEYGEFAFEKRQHDLPLLKEAMAKAVEEAIHNFETEYDRKASEYSEKELKDMFDLGIKD